MYSYSDHPGYTRYASLRGRKVFITGGASGIGASLVEAFAVQEAAVAFVDVDENSAKTLCDELAVQGLPRPWFERCDVSDIPALRRSILSAQQSLGDITVLINNAADDQRYDVRSLTEQQWLDGLAVNLHPAFFAAQTVQPMMIAQGGGAILNISSINTQFGPPNLASYITAKAGMLGITKALATDFGGDNIRVNSLLPGWVATPKQLQRWLTPEQEHEWMKRVCLKKRLGAHDVAKLALFLASDDAAMITSQQFVVDGGRS
jgi:NAD(P)-dependent dehydrogenase (short-subunit alcohol dehydrogenase family)